MWYFSQLYTYTFRQMQYILDWNLMYSTDSDIILNLKYYIYLLIYLLVHVCHRVPVEVRGKLWQVDSVHWQHGSLNWNSGLQVSPYQLHHLVGPNSKLSNSNWAFQQKFQPTTNFLVSLITGNKNQTKVSLKTGLHFHGYILSHGHRKDSPFRIVAEHLSVIDTNSELEDLWIPSQLKLRICIKGLLFKHT